jgi:hypothetical protein
MSPETRPNEAASRLGLPQSLYGAGIDIAAGRSLGKTGDR